MTQFQNKVAAGTGHRPDKLGGYGQDVFDRLVRLAEFSLENLLPEKVISGVALGWDQALAQACVNLGVPWDAYVPFVGQEAGWPAESQRFYRQLLKKAEKIVLVCDGGYAGWKMQRRNERMVDDAGVILGLWNKSPGGTANCVRYALSKRKPVLNVWERWGKEF